MKKGINMWAFEADMALEKKIMLARSAGFDGVEPVISENGDLSIDISEAGVNEFKKVAEDFGIDIPSVLDSMLWNYPLSSEDNSKRQKAVDSVKKSLYIAKTLGADTVLVIPGVVGAEFIPGTEILEYDKALDNSRDSIEKIKEYAEELKVYIGLENVWNKFLLSAYEMREFIDSFKSEYIGAYFDVGNVIPTGYPQHWISMLEKRIKKVHFKDFKRDIGNINGFVDLLAGDVNYPEVIKKLKEIGYDSYVTAEVFPYKNYPEVVVYNTSNAMDSILGREKKE